MRSCTGFTIIRKHGRPMNHYFVFAGTGAALYSRNMPFPTFRRLVSTVTAALFLFSAVAHHVVATGMSTGRRHIATTPRSPRHRRLRCQV